MLPTLAAYLHKLDPFAVRFPAWGFLPEGIRWYGLSYLLGFFIAFLLIRRVVRVGVSTLKPAEVGDLIVTLAIGVVVGGRLGYVLFYRPELLWHFSGHAPWWGVLMINEGGMASHGGIIGGIIGSWYYAWKHKHPWPHILDLFAYGAPLGLFFGRIANFINGELYGRPCSPGLPWAVKFPQEMYQWNPFDAVDAAKIDVMQRALKLLNYTAATEKLDYQIAATIHAIQEGDDTMAKIIEGQLTPRHPSQLYEAVLEGLVVFAVLAFLWRKPRKPLVIGGAFAVTYGLVRIIGEFFRMPDAHIMNEEFAHFGVTRGQWLSVLLILVGVALLAIFSRRKVEKMGGWRAALPPSPSGRGPG